MGRPKETSDRAVLAAAARVIGRRGPAEFTIREVADEAGVSAASVMQRFRTKRGLLLALEEDARASVAEAFAQARETHASPSEALADAYARTAASIRTPSEMANHLAFLSVDVADPTFRALTVAAFDDMRARTVALLRQATTRGELPPATDVERLARRVERAYHGALVTWAFRPEGPIDEAAREAVRDALGLSPPPPSTR